MCTRIDVIFRSAVGKGSVLSGATQNCQLLRYKRGKNNLNNLVNAYQSLVLLTATDSKDFPNC